MTTIPSSPTPDMGVVAVTAEIEIDGVRYSHTEGVTADTWRAGGDNLRAFVRDTVLDRLGAHLARHLPVTVIEPAVDASHHL